MYPLLIGAGLSSAVILPLLLLPKEAYYISGPLLGMVVFVLNFVLFQRFIANRVRPFFELAQRQAQSGNVPQAIQSFEKVLAYKNWQLFLEGQINTPIGTLHYAVGEEKMAAEFLL